MAGVLADVFKFWKIWKFLKLTILAEESNKLFEMFQL
jgi:hypothetical protein